MPIKLQLKELKKSLSQVKPFSSQKNELQSCVYITIADGTCKLKTFNAYGEAICCFKQEGELDGVVELQKLHAVLGQINGDTVSLKRDSNSIVLSARKMRVSLPVFEYKPPVLPVQTEESKCHVQREEWLDRSGRMAWLNTPAETRIVQACRVVCEQGKLFVVASGRNAWACSNMAYTGDEIEASIPHEAMSSLNAALKNIDAEAMEIIPGNNQCRVLSGNFQCIIKETAGKPPRLPSAVITTMQDASNWNVDREDVVNILSTAGIFLTECATGLWLIPQDDGLHISFTGQSDGTLAQDQAVQGRCASVAEGECEGEQCYMTHRFLSPMVKNAKNDGFLMQAAEGRVAVSSDNYFSAASTMSEPIE